MANGSADGMDGVPRPRPLTRARATSGFAQWVRSLLVLAALLTAASAGSLMACTIASAAGGPGRAAVKRSSRVVSRTSSRTRVKPPKPPKKKQRPEISGTVEDGQLLTAASGVWKGATPIAFGYQWQVCVKKACEPIAGATEPTYRVDTTEIGHSLEVVVTASNAVGGASATSKRTALVVPGPPVSVAPPIVSGTPAAGQTLEASTGAWVGTAPFSYHYQWLSCDLLGECFEIAGATSSTYTVQPLDVASSLEVVVTATNESGSATATSEAAGPVAPLPPLDSVLPSITGVLTEGQLLGALVGSWEGTGPLSFSYQWELCDVSGGECSNISEALASTLSLASGDVGRTLRVAVTASNAAGSTTAVSEPTSLVQALLPGNTELPSITGTLVDGQVLKALTGSWSGTTPISYSYQWELCNSKGGECSNISEALASTLSLASGDVGKTLRVVVTATNQAGSKSAASEATSVVAGLVPSNTSVPTISGVLALGHLLTASEGSWKGTTPITYTYQWQNCGALGASCQSIAGAVESVFKLELAAVGLTFRVVVTAKNVAGSTSADSAVTIAIP